MVKKNYIRLLSFILILPLVVAFYFLVQNYKEKKSEDDWIKDAASDAYLKVADLDLVVPIVALVEPRYAYAPYSFSLGSSPSNEKASLEERIRFKELSAQPESAPKVDRVEILIRQYQYTGERTSSAKICPLLKRDWAIYFCEGKQKKIMQELPEKFYIADMNRLDLFSSHYTVGGEKVADQLHKLKLDSLEVDISCDGDGKFCTAGVQTTPGTLAVWTVWPSEKPSKTARQMAESQGRAIKAFVKHAIGTQPDFKKMEAEITSINR